MFKHAKLWSKIWKCQMQIEIQLTCSYCKTSCVWRCKYVLASLHHPPGLGYAAAISRKGIFSMQENHISMKETPISTGEKHIFHGEKSDFPFLSPVFSLQENHTHPHVKLYTPQKKIKLSLKATWTVELLNRANLWWLHWKKLLKVWGCWCTSNECISSQKISLF